MSLEKMAARIACEMVEHNLDAGATHLDLDFIADQSCELAYKIHEKAKQYKKSKDEKPLTKSEIKKMILSEVKPQVAQSQPNQY